MRIRRLSRDGFKVGNQFIDPCLIGVRALLEVSQSCPYCSRFEVPTLLPHCLDKVQGGLSTLIDTHLHCPHHGIAHLAANAAVQSPGSGKLNTCGAVRRLNRHLACEQVIRGSTQGIDIGKNPEPGVLAILLKRHIAGA